MGDLLNIDPTLAGVGGGITVRDVDGDVVVVAVGEVDVVTGCVGCRCGCSVFVVIFAVDFDANNVRVTHVVKVFTIEVAKPTPTQCITNPPCVSTFFVSKVAATATVFCAVIETKIVWSRE
jgi:hypothetical protein